MSMFFLLVIAALVLGIVGLTTAFKWLIIIAIILLLAGLLSGRRNL